MKTCSTCHIRKNVNDFHKWNLAADGLKDSCKECRKKEAAKNYLKIRTRTKREKIEEEFKLYDGRTCTKCLILKPKEEFYKDKCKINGYSSYCKACSKNQWKEFKTNNPRISRTRNLKNLYKMSDADYNKMLIDQDNKCKICMSSDTGKRHKHFHVDHCHISGKIRGLLCHKCNTGIGLLQTNVKVLQNAIKYITNLPN